MVGGTFCFLIALYPTCPEIEMRPGRPLHPTPFPHSKRILHPEAMRLPHDFPIHAAPQHTYSSWHAKCVRSGVTVNSRLDRVRDWPGRARDAKYQLQALARISKVSERQLRRFICERFETRAKHWLDGLRADAAKEDFARGELAKAASCDVRFNHASNFTRFLKRVTGQTPQNLIHQIAMSEIDKESPEKVRDGRYR
jgi:AraC-like DNA-binding protein